MRRIAAIFPLLAAVSACGGAHPTTSTPNAGGSASSPDAGLEVHETGGRPRLAVVRREGDPASAIAIEVRVGDADGGARTAALTALLAARLETSGAHDVEAIAGAEYARVRALATIDATLAAKVDAALSTPLKEGDPAIGAIARALEAFGAQPTFDPALARAARCLDRPMRPPTWKALALSSIAATVEGWRAAAVRADAIVVALVGKGSAVDAFAGAWRSLAPLAANGSPASTTSATGESFVRASAGANEGGIVVVESGTRDAAVGALAALIDPASALRERLRAQDGWRARSVLGAARPDGACVVVELEPTHAPASASWNADRATAQASVAIEVARQEILLALAAEATTSDGEAARVAIARGGDPREAADRAAWWAWSARAIAPTDKPRTTATFDAPLAVMTKSGSATFDADAALFSLGPKFAAAMERARLAWARDEIELRSRVEVGQGETWVTLGSSCGVGHESSGDAGLASVAMAALVEDATPRASDDDVVIEPWGSVAGVGVVAHAAARPNETPKSLAFRVADVAARSFLATFPSEPSVVDARADSIVALTHQAPAGKLVHGALVALSAERPSWLEPLGAVDAIARVGLASVDLRLATLRASSLRMAVIADAEGDAVTAASRAAERWVARRPGESRSCPVVDAGTTPKGGIHPITVASGTGVAIALPIEETQRDAAVTLAAILDGHAGRLEASLAGLATSYSARLVRGLGSSALVLVVLCPDANVDAVAMRMRALLDGMRTGSMKQEELSRAEIEREDARIRRHLDPRARVVDLFLGELGPAAPLDLPSVKAVAAKAFDEAHMQLVLARLK